MLSSCNASPEKLEEGLPEDVVNVSASRVSGQWIGIAGEFQYQFTFDRKSEKIDYSSGVLVMQFVNFSSPQLCSFGESCICTGFVEAKVTKSNINSATSNPSTSPYNPLDPTPDVNVSSSLSKEMGKKYTENYYTLSITNQSMSPNCTVQVDNRTIAVFYFNANGSLVLMDRGIQYLSSGI